MPIISSRLIITAPEKSFSGAYASVLSNGSDCSNLAQDALDQVASIESAALGFVVTGYFGRPADLAIDEDARRWLIPVGILSLSVRSMNCLRSEGISTVGELLERTTEDLLSISNMGRKSVSEIRERLTEWGVSQRAPNSIWKRTLDLRLLLSLSDIDPELESSASRAGYTSVWELCAADPIALHNRFESNMALRQVEGAMERLGVPLSTVVPKWLPPAATQIRDAFAAELLVLKAECPQPAPPPVIHVVAKAAQTPGSSLADEIERFILAGVKPEYKKVLSMRKGWDGGFGATLEEVGVACGLTRERVRL